MGVIAATGMDGEDEEKEIVAADLHRHECH